MYELKSLGNPKCELAESPLWDPDLQVLYWTDVPAGCLWRYDDRCKAIEPVWQGDMAVGAVTLAQGGLILYGSRGIWRGYWQDNNRLDRLEPLYESIKLAEDERFNDVITDPRGRVFAGTLTDRREEGVLYRLEAGKKPIKVLEHIGNSNGMGFSPDLDLMYHTDTQIRTIRRFRYHIDTGEITKPEVIYKAKEDWGKPDGMTVDAEGNLWVACFYAGVVLKLDLRGKLLERMEMPAKNITSVAFGGANLDRLFITSARNKADNRSYNEGGNVFVCSPGVTGKKEYQAKIH